MHAPDQSSQRAIIVQSSFEIAGMRYMRIETLQTGSEPTADLAGPAAAPQSASLEVLHFEVRMAAFVKLLNRAAWIVGAGDRRGLRRSARPSGASSVVYKSRFG